MTPSNTTERIRDLLVPSILFALSSLIWASPLILDQFAWMIDLHVHYQWAAQFEQAVREGVWVPRWAALSHDGLGDATFLHIHPLFYYLVTAINTVVSDLWLSMKSIVILSHLVLALGVYRFVYRRFGRRSGFLAGLTAQWMPYHFVLISYTQSFPVLLAIALVAFVFDAAFRDRADPKWISRVALLLCGVVIAHILVAFTLLLTLTLAIVVSTFFEKDGSKRSFGLVVFWSTAVILGLGMCGWYWIPAVFGRYMINPQGWELGQQWLSWDRNFVFPIFIAVTEGSTSAAILWLAPLPLFLISVFALRMKARGDVICAEGDGKLTFIVLLTCLVSLFFSCGLSWPVWKLLPVLQQLQFPSRFLGVAGIAAALLVGSFFGSQANALSNKRLGVLSCMLCVGVTLLLAGQAFYGGKVVVPSERWLAGSFGQPEYVPAWVPSSQSNAEKTAKDLCRGESKRCSLVRGMSHEKVYRVLLDQATDLEFPIYFHPGWHATLAGAAIELRPSDARGLVEATIPAGEHVIKIYWHGTALERLGMWVSVVSLLLGISLPIILSTLSGSGQRELSRSFFPK